MYRVTSSCATCLYDKQQHRCSDEAYLAEIKSIIDSRDENDTSPYLVYRFNQVHEKMFGPGDDYCEVKKQYNDLVLGLEDEIRKSIEASSEPLLEAMLLARTGNYIDFGAMASVDSYTFLKLLAKNEASDNDKKIYESFVAKCKEAKNFLLICDNCGEIVIDKLFVEYLKEKFPKLSVTVMVRGDNVLNDATLSDAIYVGMDSLATIITNGKPIGGTVYELLPIEAKHAFDEADVILVKGQGNYESLSGQGFHVFYAFLCKCQLFTNRFDVPKLTGIFVEE